MKRWKNYYVSVNKIKIERSIRWHDERNLGGNSCSHPNLINVTSTASLLMAGITIWFHATIYRYERTQCLFSFTPFIIDSTTGNPNKSTKAYVMDSLSYKSGFNQAEWRGLYWLRMFPYQGTYTTTWFSRCA